MGKSFILQYVDEVLEDLECMSAPEIEDAITKIQVYTTVGSTSEGVQRWLGKVLKKLRATAHAPRRTVKSYFDCPRHHSVYVEKEESL